MSKKIRRTRSLIICLVLAMVVTMAACTPSVKGSVTEPTNSGSNQQTAQADKTAEKVPIDIIFFGLTASAQDIEQLLNSDVIKAMEEETGVRLSATAVDDSKKQVILAGGDLTDIVCIEKQTDISPMISGKQIRPLNNLIENYGNNVKSIRPERLKMAQTLLSDGSGEAYVLPIYAGKEDRAPKVSHSIYMTRWDYYKELGFPEIKTPDDMLELLKDMQEAHPKTDDGKPVYGVSFYTSDSSTIDFDKRFHHTFGFHTINDNISWKVSDESMVFNYTDPNGPYWMAAEYYNKAYRMGILDPDSFTQKSDDFATKVTAGQILSPWLRAYARSFETAENASNPNSLRGFQTIPVEGVTLWTNVIQAAGWEAFYLAIPQNCKNPEKAMEFINFCFGYDGSRLISSGIEGVHWKYVNGVPTLTDEIKKLERERSKEWEKTGINAEPLPYFLGGVAALEVHPDGGPVNLFASDEYYASLSSAMDLDYSKHYGAEYPYGVFLKLIDEGKVFDRSTVDMRVISGIGSAPEDIQRIDVKLLDIAVKAIPKAVLAESEADFQKIKNETIAELIAAGANTSKEWWQNRYNEVKDFFKE